MDRPKYNECKTLCKTCYNQKRANGKIKYSLASKKSGGTSGKTLEAFSKKDKAS